MKRRDQTILSMLVYTVTMLLIASSLRAFPGTMSPQGSIEACKQDYEKLQDGTSCPKTAHEQTEIDCLLSNLNKLSPTCKDALKEQKDAWQAKDSSFAAVKKVCKEEVAKLGLTAKPQKAAMVEFMLNKDQISAACKKSINEHIAKHLSGLRPLD